MENIQNYGTFTYYSDSDSQFERAFAYIIKDGYDRSDARYASGGIHQRALWKLLYNYRGPDGRGSVYPFSLCSTADTSLIGNRVNEFIANQRIGKIPYSRNGQTLITTTGLKMDIYKEIGSVNVTSISGNVESIYVKWQNGETAKISSGSGSNNTIQFYSNSSCTTLKDVTSIKEGLFYIKNNKKSQITEMKIKVKSSGNGYRVNFDYYHSNYAQDVINAWVENGEPAESEMPVSVKYLSGKITVRKIDYDDNTLLNNVKFAIFEKDKGWLGYNTKTNSVTYDNSWKNAYKFTTGVSYCGNQQYNGEFTLSNLRYGYYYLFEVDNSNNNYSLKGQTGYNFNSGNGVFTKDSWKMQEDGKDIPRILCGGDLYKKGLLYLDMEDGTPYEFRSTNKKTIGTTNYIHLGEYTSSYTENGVRNYVTGRAVYTIKNRKNTKLKIVKQDEKTEAKLKNVGIKILIKLKERVYNGDTLYQPNTWVWLKSNGAVTSKYSEASQFKTNNDGIIEIEKVPYGDYYIYETKAATGYKLSEQDNYKKGKPSDYNGTFISGGYVYLGKKTIQPKTSNKITNVVISGVYKIASNKNKNFVLDVYAGSTDDDANIDLWMWNATDAQKFRISYVEKGNYLIRNVKSGKCLAVGAEALHNGMNVKQYHYLGTSYQQWYLGNTGNGYKIRTRRGPQTHFIDINEGKMVNGQNVQLYEENNTEAQKFTLTKLDGNYTIATSSNGVREETLVANNKPSETEEDTDVELNINKIDGTTNENLGGIKFKIYGTNLKDTTKQEGWIKQVQTNEEIGIQYVDNFSDATEFITDDEGMIKIKKIAYGTYHFYEVESIDGYKMELQDGYMKQAPGSSSIDKNAKWVYQGNSEVTKDNNKVDTTIINYNYVTIKGFVWEENLSGKINDYNNIYDNNNNDRLLEGIQVKLYKKQGNKQSELLAETTTNKNGEYEFKEKNDGSKLIYKEVSEDCFVEFLYNNKEYTIIKPLVGNDMRVNSKAQAEEINDLELYDMNIQNEVNGAYPGRAITYNGNDGDRLLGAYYNEKDSCIENINFGLLKKYNPTYTVTEQLEYIKIVKGNYTFTYKYGENAVTEQGVAQGVSTVREEKVDRTFTQGIYPCDIKYNLANQNPSDEYRVYVVYKMVVNNLTSMDWIDNYSENALYITQFENTFDQYRYQLSYDVLDGDDPNISNDFGLWHQENDKAIFDINNSSKSFKEGNSGIGPGQTEQVYLEFKVTDNALTDLLTISEEDYNTRFKSAPTKTTTHGYHKYERQDKNWQNEENYTHYSIDDIKEDASLYILWKLFDNRKLSGTVFEDSKASENPNERLGNGILDEGENKVSNLKVALIDANTGNIANTYNGDLKQDADGKWIVDKTAGLVDVNENGYYELQGVVPGRYYLQFIYGDGSIKYKDMQGNDIDVNVETSINGTKINTSNYKSTIRTMKNDLSNEKQWFIDNMDNQNEYSIAVDSIGYTIDENGNITQKIDDIINYRQTSDKVINHSTSQERFVLNAISPISDINFEYVKNKEIAHNDEYDSNGNRKLNSNCSKLDFGIIERPHVELELKKVINNLKLTLQNGTTIINGNPLDQNMSEYVVGLQDNYSKLEIDKSNLYGSSVEVDYKLSIINNSELDYATRDYYLYGTDKQNLVTTTVTKIVDYIDGDDGKYNNEVNIIGDGNNPTYFSDTVINNNKKYKSSIIEINKELTPKNANLGNYETPVYDLSITRLLGNFDESMGWGSFTEIIEIKNVTFTPLNNCKSGNYIVRGENEADNDDAVIAIYPKTGENKNYTNYIIGLCVSALGFITILILMKIKKKK